jgi:hypothetical protein
MLRKFDINLNVLILLGAIILNHILLLAPNLTFFAKIIFLLFIFFSFFYFSKFRENKILLLFILILFIITLGTPTTAWDARSIWLLKAKLIFYDQTIININLNSPNFSNSNYPVVAPAFAATLVSIIGHWNEIFPKAAFTLMFIPPLILLNKFIYNNFFLLAIVMILFFTGKYLINGELDGLLSVYFVISAIMFYKLEENNRSNIHTFVLIFLNIILTLLKVEGSILLISLVTGSIIIFFNNKKIFKNIILISTVSFIPVIIWNIFSTYSSLDGSSLNNSFTIDNLSSRVFFFKNYMIIFKYLLLNEKFLISLFILFFSLFFFKNNKILFLVFYTSFIYLFFLFIIYLSSSLDLDWYLNSASRVIKPIALFFSIFSIYNAHNQNKNILK